MRVDQKVDLIRSYREGFPVWHGKQNTARSFFSRYDKLIVQNMNGISEKIPARSHSNVFLRIFPLEPTKYRG